ncbi:MAG: tRNA (adenosine(37)-N6)-threonylcarbamoyltransferase complex transferase subunit TsaD [Clostridiaceae bacterium]|nr:tRNA (adenosine(37)-N6)-threonylcarbamoyltransferase complex transferase subunit TsaD [Clostridiaceae bacterium]
MIDKSKDDSVKQDNIALYQETKTRDIRILGIETSCDETAAAVVVDGARVLSNVVASQIDLHRVYGGVVPEIASREHVKAILPVIDRALHQAEMTLADLDGIAVTFGPGLIGALLVGVAAAKGFTAVTGLPLIPIHHIEGHVASAYLANPALRPPFLALIVSGGHASIIEVRDWAMPFREIARTRDDAPGEAFDKIARVLGLSYPGGPAIEKAAQGGRDDALHFPEASFEDSFDFSFSGVKTAAINAYRRIERQAEREGRAWPRDLTLQDFAASFQKAIVNTLVSHTERALDATGYKTLVIGGGVSANRCLRDNIEEMAKERVIALTIPPLTYCTDNAAMIASAGYFAWRAGRRAGSDLDATAMANLEDINDFLTNINL